MSAIETYARTLARAAQIVGGEKNLAARLGVPLPLLDDWIAGRKAPSQRVFLLAVDIVMEQSAGGAGKSSSGGEPTRPRKKSGS